MKRLKNQDGSTILWAMLLTVILTLLLTSILTLALSYYNATLNSVKNQQAYFTARSAADAIEAELADKGSSSSLMPAGIGSSFAKTVTDFGFNQTQMGTANATITKTSTTTLELNINATFRDQKYNLKSTITKQPIYFGGIAVKTLDTGGHTFIIGDKTDLYIGDGEPTNPPVDFSGSLKIGGNLICEGNIYFSNSLDSSVNTHYVKGKIYNRDINDGNPKKKIWSSTEYIMSNYNLKVTYPALFNNGNLFNSNILLANFDLYGLVHIPLFNYGLNSNGARYIYVMHSLLDYTLHVSGIQYNQHASSEAVANTYIKVEGNTTLDIDYAANFAGWIYNVFDTDSSYITVYLGSNSTLSLGCSGNAYSKDFHMSIYGDASSKVILNDGVTVNGSINVGTLQIAGNGVTVNYSTSGGTPVAKQKVDELWLNSGYDQ